MKNVRIQVSKDLYEVAEAQQGYFTTAQAIEAGIADNAHPYHVNVGNWVREWRGIYRLSQFPESEDSYMVLWALWSRTRSGEILGVYSHETALSIHDLSDVNPAKLHLTVPPGFRRSAKLPKVLVLHKGKIGKTDYIEKWGYRVTKPYRTIVDLLDEGRTSLEHVKKAISQSLKRGFITGSEYKKMKEIREHGKLIRDLMGEKE